MTLVASNAEAAFTAGGRSVPAVVAPPPGHPRFPLCDSLRAVAAISILVAHSATVAGVVDSASYRALFAHSNVGQPLFFLLSAFLLYRPFVSARVTAAPAPKIRDYARRRLLRIMPAYWLALTVLAIYPGLQGVFTHDWWVYYGLLQIYPVHAGCGCGLVVTWTLAVEVAFYAALPLYVLAMNRFAAPGSGRRWIRRELLVILTLAAVSLLVRAWSTSSDGRLYLQETLGGTFVWFSLGLTLAIASVAFAARERPSRAVGFVAAHPMAPWAAAAVLYGLLTAWRPGIPVPAATTRADLSGQLGAHVVLVVIAALIFLPAIFGDRAGGLPRRLLGSRILRWLGLVSYGIFLWHAPILFELNRVHAAEWIPGSRFVSLTAATLALSTACAAVSYYVVERPLMRLKYRSRDRESVKPAHRAPVVPQNATAAAQDRRL